MDKFIVFEFVYGDWGSVGTFDAMSDAVVTPRAAARSRNGSGI